MNWWQALLMGLIQGISEFLPISSSGHLTLAQNFMSLGTQKEIEALNVALHVPTLLVIMIVYRKKILSILYPIQWKYLMAIVVTSIPTGIIGLTISHYSSFLFNWAALFLILNGLMLLLINQRVRGEGKDVEVPILKHAFFIGIAQGFAALPGISRSGSTIGLGRFCGLKAEKAAEYSLLASIPAILAATLKDLKEISHLPSLDMVFLSMVTTGITGWFAIQWLISISKKGTWSIWGIYCMLAGLICIGIKALAA